MSPSARLGLGRPSLWLAVAVTLATAFLYLPAISPPILDRLESETLDFRFRLRGAEAPGPETVIVAADEASMKELGRWPVSRRVFAAAIRNLSADGAKVIAMDLLFPEPEAAVAADLQVRLAEIAAGLPADSEGARRLRDLAAGPGADQDFADAIAKAGNVILGFALSEGDDAKPIAPAPAFVEDWAYGTVSPRADGTTDLHPVSRQLLAPVAVLGEAAAGGGFVNIIRDSDSAPRTERLALPYADELYPPLGVAAAAAYLGLKTNQLQAAIGTGIRIGERQVAGDDEMRMIVNYLGRHGQFPTYSLADVAAGRVPPGTFKDKIVLIGATLIGLQDFVRTPFDTDLPGVERHAAIIDRILHGPLLTQPAGALLIDIAAILLLGLAISFVAARLPAMTGAFGVVLLTIGWWLTTQWALFPGGIRLNVVFPTIAIIGNFVAVMIYRIIAEEKQRRRAEQELRVSEERYALAARGANDGLWDWDLAADRLYTSPRWQQMVGVDAAAVTGDPKDWFDRVHRDDIETLRGAIEAHLAGRSTQIELEFRIRHGDGEDRWMQVRGLAVRGDSGAGKPHRMAGSMTDITGRKLAEKQLLFDAFHSRLTGLPNRALLCDRIDQALQLWQRGGESDVIVVIVDLDHFNHINETLGQTVGDQVLISLARSFGAVLRPDDTIAHLGEDEFAILRFAAGQARLQAEQLIASVQAVLAKPVQIETRKFELTASIGYVFASESVGTRGDELLRDASLALFRAKSDGRNWAQIFDSKMHQTAVKRFDMEADLRRALAVGGELELFYQPIIDILNDKMFGFEALIRWRHPTRGLIPPLDFIPLAEDTGLIVEIGRRSIGEACRQIAAWMPAKGTPPQIAVNVSGRQFAADGLAADIEKAIKAANIPAKCLKLEVTESLIMDNPERTVEVLRQVIAQGCKVSIDDFGTGYSSLSHLHRLPFHTLKIDRSFIIRMTDSKEGYEIVRVIAQMAKILGRNVVAEGVETQEQLDQLRKLGVDFAQGYFYSKPLPAADASAFLDKWRQEGRTTVSALEAELMPVPKTA